MRVRPFLLAALVAVVAFPVAPADPAGCQPVTDPSATSVGGMYYAKLAALDGRYPPVQARMWAESNGFAGLQTSYTSCGMGAPPVGPDSKVADSAQFL